MAFPNPDLCVTPLSSRAEFYSRFPSLQEELEIASGQKAKPTTEITFFVSLHLGISAVLLAGQYTKTVVSSVLVSFLAVHGGKAIPDPVILSW